MKTWKNLSKTNDIDENLNFKLERYIEESFNIQTKLKFEEEEEFTSKLPKNLREEFLRESNKKILNRINYFKNFTAKTINEIAHSLVPRIVHPDEIVFKKEEEFKFQILKKGQVGYYPGSEFQKNSKFRIELLEGGKKSEILLWGSFLPCKFQKNYDVKSIGYSIISEISLEKFTKIIKKRPMDF